MMLVAGLGTALYFSQGLAAWAGLIAWAAVIDAGGDGAAFRRTTAGVIAGVIVGWAAEVAVFAIQVDPATSQWIPRSAGVIALSLALMVVATRVKALSLPSMLYGFAAVFAAVLMPNEQLTIAERLRGFHLYNPLFQLVISMVGGAALGLLTNRLADALTKK